MLQILSREGKDPKVSGHFFKAVVQSVLLSGVEKTPRMERSMISFQHRIAQRLIRRQKRRRGGGGS